MRIALLSCFYPYRGGIAQFNASFMQNMSGEAELKAFNFKRQYPDLLFPGKTQYVRKDDDAGRIESERILDCANPLSYLPTAKSILKWKPDIVVFRYWMSWFAPSLGFIARYLKRHGVKTVAITDNIIPHERHFFDEPLTRYFLSGMSACIALCDNVASDLKNLYPDMPTKVIPHPLYDHFGESVPKVQALKDLGLDPSKKTLLFFGLIREYKGLDILLEAFKGLPDDYQLIIAGEPYGSFEKYSELIREIPDADKRISLTTSYIKDSDVKKYFSGADLCVLPYRSATQSGISAISFHFEVPMAVTDTGGLKQTIADCGCGVLCKDCTAEAVKECIEGFFSSPANMESCVQGIRAQKQKIGWKAFCREFLDLAKTL